MSEHIYGKITKIFGKGQKADKWFAGLVRLSDGDVVKIAGTANTMVSVGTVIECDADLIDTDYGEQYRPVQGALIQRVLTTRNEIVTFLGSDLFPGIGPTTANTLYDKYGASTIYMLQNCMDTVVSECKLNTRQEESLRKGIRSNVDIAELLKAFPHMKASTASRILDAYEKVRPDVIIRHISKDPYLKLIVDLKVSIKEADTIGILDMGVPVFDKGRMEVLIYKAIMGFCSDRNATYVKISDPMEWAMFFYKYFLRSDLYQPFPQMWGRDVFNEDCLAKHIAAGDFTGGGSSGLLEVSDLRPDSNGQMEVALYARKMARAEQILSNYLAQAWLQDPAFYKERFAKCCARLKIMRKMAVSNGGPQLTPEQEAAVRNVFQYGLSFISGGPGRGKTFVLKSVIEIWERVCWSNHEGAEVLMLAPTGKAVARMKAQTNRNYAETVARFLVMNKDISKQNLIGPDGKGLLIRPTTLIIVDEVSMLNFMDAAKLLERIRGCTIVFVGDKNQLPPIEPGPFLQEAIRSQKINIETLVTNHRQKSPELNDNADKILAGSGLKSMQFTDAFQFLPCDERSVDGEKLSMAEKFILDRYQYYLAQGSTYSDIMVITPFASEKYPLSSRNLNRLMQDQINPIKQTSLIKTAVDDFGKYMDGYGLLAGATDMDGLAIRIGDRVMNTKNNLDLGWQTFQDDVAGLGFEAKETTPDDGSNIGIFNGDMGTVIRAYPSQGAFHICIQLDDPRSEQERTNDPRPARFVYVVTEMDGNRLPRLKDWCLGYALSVHKAQGSEADHVIVALSESGYRATEYMEMNGGMPFLTKNMLYTAVTRARETVLVVGSKDAFEACMAKPYRFTNVRLAESIDEDIVRWKDLLAAEGYDVK